MVDVFSATRKKRQHFGGEVSPCQKKILFVHIQRIRPRHHMDIVKYNVNDAQIYTRKKVILKHTKFYFGTFR